ncbi:MAG: EF-P beta-lysylation protein EpmB [Steroidobacteraceae bacterium]|jgi:EF-P beta-lysylation protein EpmB|nr:EF-P beta-lysylation protein EpmB [Steroidobacteraceae bacterium]
MITATPKARQTSAWQRELAAAITDPRELLEQLGLPASLVEGADPVSAAFPLRVPRGFVRRMRRGDPADPLLRQVLPLAVEARAVPGYVADPLREADARRAPGLLHKYRGRALLVATGACAVHCRYCFRREFPYAEQVGHLGRWREALLQVSADASIRELILSGGDPLSLGDERLAQLTGELAGIPHLETLRIHTRQPVVLPERVDAGLLGWLRHLPWRTVVVLHVNHPNELDGSVYDALAGLRDAGATLLNQSVLLAGVNDDASVLAALSRRLHRAGVLPYYLHLPDAVAGTAHFDVPESRGRELIADLARELPGYLVPRLVREVPGRDAKTTIAAGLGAAPEAIV